MTRSAQDKFNELRAEIQETSKVISEFVTASHQNYGNYAYTAGVFESTIKDLIAELPKARRDQLRQQFRNMTQKQLNEALLKSVVEGL